MICNANKYSNIQSRLNELGYFSFPNRFSNATSRLIQLDTITDFLCILSILNACWVLPKIIKTWPQSKTNTVVILLKIQSLHLGLSRLLRALNKHKDGQKIRGAGFGNELNVTINTLENATPSFGVDYKRSVCNCFCSLGSLKQWSGPRGIDYIYLHMLWILWPTVSCPCSIYKNGLAQVLIPSPGVDPIKFSQKDGQRSFSKFPQTKCQSALTPTFSPALNSCF